MHNLIRSGSILFVLVVILFTTALSQARQIGAGQSLFKPNILWVTSEDTGTELGCYGDTNADTPNLDALAAKGMKFGSVWSNAPVCAPARTTIITGFYATTIGAQHMRSAVPLPAHVKPFPQLLRELGYYCTNNSKTDYNLVISEESIWDDSSNKAHWRGRKAGQPFFAVFNFTESHESQIRSRPHKAIHDPARMKLPPYHPDTQEVRSDWAQYYDQVSKIDQRIGELLRQLEADGLSETTIVFYFGDHGNGMPRHKRWLYEGGLRVPLIITVPDRIKSLVEGDYHKGTTSERLVNFVDLAPTVLSLAGIRPPAELPGSALLGRFVGQAPKYLYGFRDRMDERYDMSRSIRDQRYAYIRNFLPHRPQGMFLDYMFQTPTTVAWKKLYDDEKLDEVQSVFWKIKPSEELYDLESDPHQINNLVDQPQFREIRDRLKEQLFDWMISNNDTGLLPEGEMWSRSGSQPPTDLVKQTGKFPVKTILSVADLASDPKQANLESLLDHRVHQDSACRFWVAQGLLLRACLDQDRSQCVKAARAMSGDSSPFVRTIANEVVARFGTAAEQELAIKSLIRAADVRSEGYFAGLHALNSLVWTPVSTQLVGNSLEGLPELTLEMHQRYKTYIPRLVEQLTQPADEPVR